MIFRMTKRYRLKSEQTPSTRFGISFDVYSNVVERVSGR
jgi:hypothetical protein